MILINFVSLKFAAKLLQHHEIRNRKCYLITLMGGNMLIINVLQTQLLTQRQHKDYLQLDRLCKKLENSEEEIPIFFKIRFFKIRILPLA